MQNFKIFRGRPRSPCLNRKRGAREDIGLYKSELADCNDLKNCTIINITISGCNTYVCEFPYLAIRASRAYEQFLTTKPLTRNHACFSYAPKLAYSKVKFQNFPGEPSDPRLNGWGRGRGGGGGEVWGEEGYGVG
jgi:hypothetical protein